MELKRKHEEEERRNHEDGGGNKKKERGGRGEARKIAEFSLEGLGYTYRGYAYRRGGMHIA